MNQTQIKHLRERITKAERQHSRELYKEGPMSPEVKKAKAIVRKWEEKDNEIGRAAQDRVRLARVAAEEALCFEDPAAALKAVKAFEAMKFTK